MTSVLVDFNYFNIIFVNCDEVYNYIEACGGRSEYILDNVAESLRKSTAYIKLSENHKRFSRFYTSKFNMFDIMDGIYRGLFKMTIDNEICKTIAELDDEDSANLMLYLNEYEKIDDLKMCDNFLRRGLFDEKW